MRQVNGFLGAVLILALVAGVLATPAMAAGSGVVKGKLVSYDRDTSKLIVKNEEGGEDVTLTTTKRTAVEGINPGITDMQSAEALVGLEGVYVTVKWKDTADGPEARFVRVYPHKQG